MTNKFKATIEYRDEHSHGQWRTHSVTSDVCSDAVGMVRAHCRDCETRNLKVEAV